MFFALFFKLSLVITAYPNEYKLIVFDPPTSDTLQEVIFFREYLKVHDVKEFLEFYPNFFIVTNLYSDLNIDDYNGVLRVETGSSWSNWENVFPETAPYMKEIWKRIPYKVEVNYKCSIEPFSDAFLNLNNESGGDIYNSMYAPYGAKEYDTSNFLVGSVGIQVIFPLEGSERSFNDKYHVLARAVFGLKTIWEQAPSSVSLTFVLSEPIELQSNYIISNYSYTSALHIMDTYFSKLRYNDAHYVNAYNFVNKIRQDLYTNWAVTAVIFNGYFKDAAGFAAFVGGPYFFAGYKPTGSMEILFPHEFLHCFGAGDEYLGSNSQWEKYGYLGVANNNHEAINQSPEPCIMRAQNQSELCTWTKQHIGWRDNNSDGIVDVDCQKPTLSKLTPTATQHNLILSVTANVNGESNHEPYYYKEYKPNYKSNNITVKTLASLIWRSATESIWNRLDFNQNEGEVDTFFIIDFTPGVSDIQIKVLDSKGLESQSLNLNVLTGVDSSIKESRIIHYSMQKGYLENVGSDCLNVQIFNLTGRVISHTFLKVNQRLSLADIPNGLYYFKIESDDQQFTDKITILH
jgi:hypothetical protein